MRLDEFLTDNHVPYERLHHRPAYTAQGLAQALHVPGREVAKAVLLRTDHGYVLTVLPATRRVDLAQVRDCLGNPSAELASEAEMGRLFPDCETGALPPFGSLYHVQTLVDDSLAEDERIVFEGQNHQEAFRMAYRDYEATEHPRKDHFANLV